MRVRCPYCWAQYDDRKDSHWCEGMSVGPIKASGSLLKPATSAAQTFDAALNRLVEAWVTCGASIEDIMHVLDEKRASLKETLDAREQEATY